VLELQEGEEVTQLKRSIFVRYRDGSGFQFTRGDDGQWLVHVTTASGPRQIRWQRSDLVDDAYVIQAIALPNVERVDQFD